MAQKVQIILVDDLDGGDASETVTFGLDGVSYEIDLNAKNAARLRDSLAPWVGSARKAGGRTRRGRGSSSARSGRTGDVRTWAKAQGLAVNARGRIPADIQAKYDAAH